MRTSPGRDNNGAEGVGIGMGTQTVQERRGSFVNPEYFRMLQFATHEENRRRRERQDGDRGARMGSSSGSDEERIIGQNGRAIPFVIGRQSPIRRLTQPVVDRVVRAISPAKEEEEEGETERREDEAVVFRDGWQSRPATRPESRDGSELGRAATVSEAAESDSDYVSPKHKSKSVSQAPTPKGGISRAAFSEGYFNTFFKEERKLGSGGRGVVMLVRHELDGVNLGHFACKRVPVGDDHKWLEKVLSEVRVLQGLSHPNLVSYRHVWLERARISRFGPRVECAFILQEYCDSGDLLQYVMHQNPKEELSNTERLKTQMRRRSRGKEEAENSNLKARKYLPFDEIYKLFHDIVAGLAHLHGAGYVHRDLKPSNCLLHHISVASPPTSPGQGPIQHGALRSLISDFGEVQQATAKREATGATGTISYCAPEVLGPLAEGGELGNFTAKSDIFSLGMILYFMCFGRLPWLSDGQEVIEEFGDGVRLREEIRGWAGYKAVKERDDLPEKVYALLGKLLARDPKERPSAEEILGAMDREDIMTGSVKNGKAAGAAAAMGGKRSPTPLSTEKLVKDGLYAERTGVEDGKPPRHKSPTPPSPRSMPKDASQLSPIELQPPLLLPPPVARHPLSYEVMHPVHTLSLLPARQRKLLSLSTRLTILLIKIYSVSTICLPWGINPLILGLLVTVMAFEATQVQLTSNNMGMGTPKIKSLVLGLAGHFALLWLARSMGRLCEGGKDGVWGWDDGH